MYHLIHPAQHDRPCDVLNDIASVVGAIDKLIVGNADLHLLGSDDLGGLCTILSAVKRGIQEASEVLGEELAEVRADRRRQREADPVRAVTREEIGAELVALLREARELDAPAGHPCHGATPSLTEEAGPEPAQAPADDRPAPSSAVPTSRRSLHG